MELIVFFGLMTSLFAYINLRYTMKLRVELAELRKTQLLMTKQVSSTQSHIGMQKRSNPYPKMPRPKAEQHYEGQGAPRKEPGSNAGVVTASGTPVRIGSIARRRVGGTESKPESP